MNALRNYQPHVLTYICEGDCMSVEFCQDAQLALTCCKIRHHPILRYLQLTNGTFTDLSNVTTILYTPRDQAYDSDKLKHYLHRLTLLSRSFKSEYAYIVIALEEFNVITKNFRLLQDNPDMYASCLRRLYSLYKGTTTKLLVNGWNPFQVWYTVYIKMYRLLKKI